MNPKKAVWGPFALPLALLVLCASTEDSTTATRAAPIDRPPSPETYFSHLELPELSSPQRIELARQARSDWQGHCNETRRRGKELSDKLEAHIRAWLGGRADAKIPTGLLPPYVDDEKTHDWTLVRPEEVDPRRQWYVLPAHEVDPQYQELFLNSVDRHVTYLKLLFVAPLGSRLLVEGDFPHARFMSYQILAPLDPEHPASGQMGENPEVSIVDADIEPDPGSTNPFRVGANRDADNRGYHLVFELSAGNSVKSNPVAMSAPAYRGPGNARVGGPFGFAGPWGDFVFTPSVLWLRIYAPDRGAGPLGGVDFPRALLQLSTGEKFWLQPDASLAVERQTTQVKAGSTPPGEPWPFIGSNVGWFKVFGLALRRAENRAYWQGGSLADSSLELRKRRIRDSFLLLFNRGAQAAPPGNYEACATCCNHISYLTRMFQLGAGKVYVITGKLPTTPPTRGGEPVMKAAEARYWSLSQYGSGDEDRYPVGVEYGSLMDDEVVVNENREYMIVLSRREDRPGNATPDNGVTWQNWGPASRQTLCIRWMSVMPEWHLPEFAPDSRNIPWTKGAWSAADYDPSLVGRNEPGIMGPYHPVIHYMTRQEFETLGPDVVPSRVPAWK